MSSLASLSRQQLAERLRELQHGSASFPSYGGDPDRLALELSVHEVELEMQNRELRAEAIAKVVARRG